MQLASAIKYDPTGAPTAVLNEEDQKTAEIMPRALQAAVKDSACVTVQAAINEYIQPALHRPC